MFNVLNVLRVLRVLHVLHVLHVSNTCPLPGWMAGRLDWAAALAGWGLGFPTSVILNVKCLNCLKYLPTAWVDGWTC